MAPVTSVQLGNDNPRRSCTIYKNTIEKRAGSNTFSRSIHLQYSYRGSASAVDGYQGRVWKSEAARKTLVPPHLTCMSKDGGCPNRDALRYMMNSALHERQPDEGATRALHGHYTDKVASLDPSGCTVLLAHGFGTDEFMRVLYVQPSTSSPPIIYPRHVTRPTEALLPGPAQL